jgi:hypothetical protein
MRKLLRSLPLLALLLLPTWAQAADLPLKAPAYSPPGYPSGCGFYYGLNALASAAPLVDAPVGVSTIGGDVGGTLGYTCNISNSTAFWFVEGMLDAQNLNGNANGLSFGGPLHIEQRVGFGGPILQLLNVLPNLNLPSVPSLPTLPSGITAGPSMGYIYGAVNEDDVSAQFGLGTAHEWLISPEVGLGILDRLSNNVVADVWAGARMETNSFCLGGTGACPKLGTGVVTGIAFKY